MRQRLALLLGALLVPALTLLVAAPAHAAGTICVNMGTACPVGATPAGSIPAAIGLATSGTKILVGPGNSYTDGPYVLPAGVSIQGSGAGVGTSATVLSLSAPNSQTYLTANGGSVQDLRISMVTGNGATGLAASNGSIVDNVVVFGVGATASTGIRAQGATLHDTTVNLSGASPSTGTAVDTSGVNTVTDSTWSGGQVGYHVTGTDTASRLTIQLADTAAVVQSGVLTIDDALLDLGTSGTGGLVVRPTGAGTTDAAAQATFLTVVGGAAASRGVVADGSAPTGTHHASVSLASSIVRGPGTATSLARVGGGTSAAFSVTHSDFASQTGSIPDDGTNLNLDPAFVDPASGNYDLRAGSPVIDRGASTTLAYDLASRKRSVDGNGDGLSVPDMGAYELNDVTAPTTVITSGPAGPTRDNTPVFTFKSGAGAVFECQIDTSPLQPCTSPVTTTPLPDGPHTFTVRARDAVFNYEVNPPKRTFTVDTVAPDTTITKKIPKRFYRAPVKVKFGSSEAGVTFQCQLDGGAWRTCRSPYRYTVSVGKHTLAVRAVDAAGNTDRTPAHEKFKRLRRPRRHHHHHHGH